MPINFFNLYGYNVRFKKDGSYKEYTLDIKAIIDHMYALSTCHPHVKIKRIIFDIELLDLLKKNPHFHKIRHIHFMKKNAWVHHDSHYHIDFETDT